MNVLILIFLLSSTTQSAFAGSLMDRHRERGEMADEIANANNGIVVDRDIQEQYLIEKDDEEKQRKERAALVKSGKIKPSTLDDLDDLYDPLDDGWILARKPKLDADNKLYLISGEVERRDGKLLYCTTQAPPDELLGSYFAINFTPKTKKPADLKDRLRIHGAVYIVGRYRRNLDYDTVAAGRRTMPIFDAVHVIIPEEE